MQYFRQRDLKLRERNALRQLRGGGGVEPIDVLKSFAYQTSSDHKRADKERSGEGELGIWIKSADDAGPVRA